MLADGAHVSIGGTSYMLMEREDGTLALDERFESLFAPTSAIAGEIAKEQIRPEKLLWSLTDFSGGEGNLIYYPQDPTTYDIGSLVNPTTRGKLTTRPRRYRSAVARAGSNADTTKRPAGTSAFSHALIAWEDNIIDSHNAISWGATQDTSPAGTGIDWADAISDGTNAAFLTGVTEVGVDTIPVVSADTSTIVWADAQTGTAGPNGPMVGAVLDGVPYTWGRDDSGVLKLFKKAAIMDSAADWGATTVYSTGFAPAGKWGEDYWTAAVAAETSLFLLYATKTYTSVWEVRADVGRPFWTRLGDFAGKKLVYSSGVLFILGNQATSGGRQYGGLWAIPLTTRSPIEVAKPRFHRNEELRDVSVGCAGPGDTVFLADASTGKIFCYDIKRDGLFLFDDLVNGGTGDSMDFSASGNLLSSLQSSFETNQTSRQGSSTGIDGWGVESGGATLTSETTAPYSGSRHAQVAHSGGATWVIITPTGLGGVEVEASTEYTFVCQIRGGSAGGETANAIIRWYDSSGTIISSSTGGNVTTTASYQTASVTATSPATAVYAAAAVQVAATVNENFYIDACSLHPGDSTDPGDKIAFLAMHGTRLFGATYSPLEAGATSLQVFSYDDLLPENRDGSQAISATYESANWDNGLPMEVKALIGFYVTFEVEDSNTTSGLLANQRITVAYSTDDSTYTSTTAITSATTPSTVKGRVFVQVSNGSSTVKYTRLKVRVTLDNNSQSNVQPPILLGVMPESHPMAYARTWDMLIRVFDEDSNERPTSRQETGNQLYTDLISLATNKNVVTFLNGAWSRNPATYTTHTVVVEDPQPILHALGEGIFRVRLRDITAA